MGYRLPCPSVLSELNDSQKGQLLAAWLTVLQDIAGLLREVWEQSDIERETMIVRRGTFKHLEQHSQRLEQGSRKPGGPAPLDGHAG